MQAAAAQRAWTCRRAETGILSRAARPLVRAQRHATKPRELLSSTSQPLLTYLSLLYPDLYSASADSMRCCMGEGMGWGTSSLCQQANGRATVRESCCTVQWQSTVATHVQLGQLGRVVRDVRVDLLHALG